MALFRRFFYRKPPDRVLEISERVYVFDCCFSSDVLEEDEYKVYLGGIVAQLQNYYPDAAFMVFNFREGERRSPISDILSQYNMTVMDYPRQYEGCPMLPLEMLNHFLRSSESWLSLAGQHNVLLMHCERGGWPVLAFMLAGLLLYRKQYSGDLKTLEMVYRQAPRELLCVLSPLNPQSTHLRYLQYISRRNLSSEWPPSEKPLYLDCVILRVLPLFDGGKGCRPVLRAYGQNPLTPTNRRSKRLFSSSKNKKHVRYYLQAECMLVKLDVHCHVQGDVVLECIHWNEDSTQEEMMFRVMFHTAFVRSNILILNRDEIDVQWDAKDRFPKEFRAEVLFLDVDAVVPALTKPASEDVSEKDSASPDEFFEVEEIFNNVVDGHEAKRYLDTQVAHKDTMGHMDNEAVVKEDVEPHAIQDCSSDDAIHIQDMKVESGVEELKDIVVDDVKYKNNEKVEANLHVVKDIVIDDGELKLDTMGMASDVPSVVENKEVSKDVCGKLDEMESKGPTISQNVEHKVPFQKSGDDRPKSEQVVSTSTRKNPMPNIESSADVFIAKEKTKQQESHVIQAKQGKPHLMSRWIPPNKGSYTNSMHVSYPPSRYNSSPPVLASTSQEDKVHQVKPSHSSPQLSTCTPSSEPVSQEGHASSMTSPPDFGPRQVHATPLPAPPPPPLPNGNAVYTKDLQPPPPFCGKNNGMKLPPPPPPPPWSCRHSSTSLALETSIIANLSKPPLTASFSTSTTEGRISASIPSATHPEQGIWPPPPEPPSVDVVLSNDPPPPPMLELPFPPPLVTHGTPPSALPFTRPSSPPPPPMNAVSSTPFTHSTPPPPRLHGGRPPSPPPPPATLTPMPPVPHLNEEPPSPSPSSHEAQLPPPMYRSSPPPPSALLTQPPLYETSTIPSSPSHIVSPPPLVNTTSASQPLKHEASFPPQPPPLPRLVLKAPQSTTPLVCGVCGASPSGTPPSQFWAPSLPEPLMSVPSPVLALPPLSPRASVCEAPPSPLKPSMDGAPTPAQPEPPIHGSQPPSLDPSMRGAPPPSPPPPPPPICKAPPQPPMCGVSPPPTACRVSPPPAKVGPPLPPPPPTMGGPPHPPPSGTAHAPGPPPLPGKPSRIPLSGKQSGAPPPPPFGAKGGAPPPPAGRGRGPLTRASHSGRRSSLKPLHWSKVTRALKGSLWEELQKYGEPPIVPEFDVSELEKLFSTSVPKPADKSKKKSAGTKSDTVHLIDLRRANNTEIMLTKVKMPLPDMMAAVLAMDESVLDVDQVENLIKFCPTKEEMELLKNYTGNKENLGKCEQFFLELMNVPRVESKLMVFAFKIQFGAQISEFRKSLNIINSTCQEVRNSEKLKDIMKKILYLGNTLNQGTTRGAAVGFKLDSLLKLADTRASTSKMTLMHYFCKVLAEKSQSLLDFHKDLVSLEMASKIQLKALAEEMQAINNGLEKVEEELIASGNDGPVSEVFCKTLEEFLGNSEAEAAAVTNLYSEVGKSADALAQYFNEDPARCPFEQVTSTLVTFVRLFRKAHDDNTKQAEAEKKKAEKDGESEAKTPTKIDDMETEEGKD